MKTLASELRIGNIMSPVGKAKIISDTIVVTDWHISKQVEYDKLSEPYLKPVPLTEEWLVKFGFVKYPNAKRYGRNDFWDCDYRNHSEWDFTAIECRIKYVHSLQNLYFALTGEELKLKQ